MKPAAFMTYVHADDLDGRLTRLREELSREITMQIGESFDIFHDRKDIAWGQNWEKRITGALNEVTFLLAIITPGFFNSEHCRKEFGIFLEREKKLRRDDLILPLYYVDTPRLNDAKKREADPIATIIAGRQYADWRELRFEPFTSPQAGKTLACLAGKVRDALERQATTLVALPGAPVRPPSEAGAPSSSKLPQPTEAERPASPTKRIEPPTLTVDAMHRGDHATISAAIRAAEPGNRILVRPGVYNEALVVDKPLEIIGDGELADIIVQTKDAHCLVFRANIGRVANITFRQRGGARWYGVDISQGRLELEGCDVSSKSLACISIHGGADPRLRRNRIRDGKQSGVFVNQNGQGTMEDNDIFGNSFAGVAIRSGGNPTLRRNRIHDGKAGGVFISENGQGMLEDNDIFGNAEAGVEITSGGNPTLRRNRIHNGKQDGVFVSVNGKGMLEENDIFANANVGVRIQEGGSPTLRRNRIHGNGYQAIWVREGSGGVIEDNDLRESAKGAWFIDSGVGDLLQRKGNLE